jgi:hypothetical protein
MRPAHLIAIALVGDVLAVGCSFDVRGRPGDELAVDAGAAAPPPLPVEDSDLARAVADLAAPTDARDPPPPPPDLSNPELPLIMQSQPLTMAEEVDLSDDGAIDWVHWGYAAGTDIDRRADGAQQIGNFTLIGKEPAVSYGDNLVGFSWSDGLPPRSDSNGPSTTGVFVTKVGNGFQLTLAAQPETRHLRLYLGGFHGRGQLVATLAGSVITDNSHGNASGKFDFIVDLTYIAVRPAQTLTVTWKLASGDKVANVTLQAATLK